MTKKNETRVSTVRTCFGMNRANTRMKICTDLPLLFPYTCERTRVLYTLIQACRVDTRTARAHERYKNHIGFMLSLCYSVYRHENAQQTHTVAMFRACRGIFHIAMVCVAQYTYPRYRLHREISSREQQQSELKSEIKTN